MILEKELPITEAPFWQVKAALLAFKPTLFNTIVRGKH